MVMEDIIVEMEESSSRIEDPAYPKSKEYKHDAFLVSFFVIKRGMTYDLFSD